MWLFKILSGHLVFRSLLTLQIFLVYNIYCTCKIKKSFFVMCCILMQLINSFLKPFGQVQVYPPTQDQ